MQQWQQNHSHLNRGGVVEITTATPVVTATITPISAVIEEIPGIDKKAVFTQLQDDNKEENTKEMELEKNENKSEWNGKEVLQASTKIHETLTLSAIEIIKAPSELMSDEEGLPNW